MNLTPVKVSTAVGLSAFILILAAHLSAQDSSFSPGAQKAAPDRKITGVAATSLAGTAVNFSAPDSVLGLPPADAGFSSSLDTKEVSSEEPTLPDDPSVRRMAADPAQQTATKPPENPPDAPTPQKNEPSLSDLGFSKSETEANVKEQALLDKRTHMLKIHQRMGLITTIPMVASVVTSLGAGGRNTGTASRDLHVALGALTGDLYGITAYYAIRAPRIKGEKKRGPIKFHEAMAWIHGPGMIATPILGAIAFSQKNNGQKVHGVAQAHGPVAIVTAGAFGAALLSVSFKF